MTTEAAIDGRQRITDEAARLFVSDGYAKTSLRDIAAAVGIKAGSIYYHFESKDDLLLAILRRGLDVMVEAFEVTTAASADAPPAERVASHVRAHLGALFEYGPYTATHVTAFHNAPQSVREAIVPDRDAYEALWNTLLTELRVQGHIGDTVDVGLSRLVLFGAMNSTVEWFHAERGNLDHLAAVIADQFWWGVAPRSSS
jgi:AcrR family transcriptional regulator